MVIQKFFSKRQGISDFTNSNLFVLSEGFSTSSALPRDSLVIIYLIKGPLCLQATIYLHRCYHHRTV